MPARARTIGMRAGPSHRGPDPHGTPLHHLFTLGFGPHFLAQLDLSDLSDTPPVGRVAFTAHGHVRLLTPGGERAAILDGPLRHDPPVVGDWVWARAGDPFVATRRFERRNVLRRRDPAGGAQVVAANVDVALICTALGRDLSARRLERWLAVAADCGADPVVVLTKADTGDVEAAVALARAVTDAPIVPVSALDDRGREALLAHLGEGRTAALLGSSGVGKSTLLNRMAGTTQATRAVRDDERGRHTTTARHLLRLPGGAWVIDNPGTRQVGPLEADAVDGAFPEVEALAEGCPWRDCAHATEPGCAVLAAVAAGALPVARLDAWRKLRRELAYEARRGDPLAEAASRDRWKRIHMAARKARRDRE